MPLYLIQDYDVPMYVVAESFGDALEKWECFVADENGDSSEAPKGVQFICDDNELIK